VEPHEKARSVGPKNQRRRPEAEWLRQSAPELRLVPEELWQAAHARLSESRALYLRHTNGQVWGHPARGTESKYVLVGLARCSVCSGDVSVRSRSHGNRRAFYYTCTTNHLRGRAVCPNDHELPMETVDTEVLAALRTQVLAPDVIDAVVARTIEKLNMRPDKLDCNGLRHALADVEAQIGHLTTAIATGGPLPSLLGKLRDCEAERQRLGNEIAAREAMQRVPALLPEALRTALRERLEEWPAPLSEHVAHARQILRKLINGRLVLSPDPTIESGYSSVSGDADYGKFFSGIVLARGMASPTGGLSTYCDVPLAGETRRAA
jgi:hypothetical protein